MPLEFPNSPTNGQVYNNYIWDSAKGVWGKSAPAPLEARILTLESEMEDLYGNWGAKGGPTGLPIAYRNVWAVSRGGSVDINPIYSTDYIQILTTGQYEVMASQRGAGASTGYISLAINGDRALIEGRTTGLFNHSHTGGPSDYTTSYYIGLLSAGELISAGGISGTDLLYSSSLFTGSLVVKRVG